MDRTDFTIIQFTLVDCELKPHSTSVWTAALPVGNIWTTWPWYSSYLLWRGEILHSVKYCSPCLNTSVRLSTWSLVSALIFQHEQYWTTLDQNMTVPIAWIRPTNTNSWSSFSLFPSCALCELHHVNFAKILKNTVLQ